MKKLITTLLAVIILFTIAVPIKSYAVENNWIYYSNHNDVGRLYKIRSDGTGITRLSIQTACDIEVLGDWLYYYNTSETGGAFRTKTDGSKTEKLVDGFENSCYGVYKDNGHIYIPYIYGNKISYGEPGDYYSELLIYDVNGYYSKEVIDSSNQADSDYISRCIEVSNNWLYLQDRGEKNEIEYYKYYLNYENNENYKEELITIKKLPQKINDKINKPDQKVNNSHFYRDKYLCWNSVNESEKYTVYRLNKTNGENKRLAETKDTYINLTVLDSDYNAEYKVVAIKTVNGTAKTYKVNLTSTEHKLGNTSGNLSNGSFAVEYSGVHYVCLSDGIYIVDEKKNTKKKIWKGEAEHINISDGCFYFVCRNHLYKMKTDCFDEYMMTSIYKPLGYNVTSDMDTSHLESINPTINNVVVSDENLFINLIGENETYDVHFFKLKIDDSDAVEISIKMLENICAINSKIVYIGSSIGGTSLIYSIDSDGKNETNISEKPANSICTYKNKIYYCNGDGIYNMNGDGTEVKLLYSTSCKSINIYDDKIYFIKAVPIIQEIGTTDEYYICSINYDGTGYKELCKANTQSINIIDDWIYYRDFQGKMYRCKTDGTCLTEVGMWEYDY